MARVRNLCRSANRCPTRPATRMLGGARRPPPPNYLALACRALEEVIRIDKRLLPYMEEQKRMLENYLWAQKCEAAMHKVYGPPDPSAPKPQHFATSPINIPQLLRDQYALAKTRALLDLLKSKTGEGRACCPQRAGPKPPLPTEDSQLAKKQ